MNVEFALDTFGDVTLGANGKLLSQDEVLRNVVREAVLADQVGVDYIGLGEHHRDDFAISSPEVILGAIAGQTSRIRLGTAVTVLSTDDPVRLFQRFSTLDAISNGRAEVVLGRGSFTESYPLFGFDTGDYDVLFEEKLDLFMRLVRDDKVTWKGQTRSPLQNVKVYPPLSEKGLKVWVGVGGSPESVVRAVRHNVPLMLAIIGGDPARFRPFVDLYKQAATQMDQEVQPIGVHSPGHIAPTDEEAIEQFWAGYEPFHNRLGRERGWGRTTKHNFLSEVTHGSSYVGSPETVARKIAKTVKTLGLSRFEMKYATGTLSHDAMMRSIELYGTKVIPRVRELLAE